MEIQNAIDAFSALAQETRLATLRELVAAGPGGINAGTLAERLHTPAPTMSFHLKELERAGLIQSQKSGRSVIYAADYGGVRALIGFLLEDCCRGDKRLCGPYIVRSANL